MASRALTRRELGPLLALAATGSGQATAAKAFRPRYVLASALYGRMPLAEVLAEVRKAGADAIDIWPLPHGNQREQIDEMGLERFEALLARHRVTLGLFTQYPRGPFGLAEEMKIVRRLGGRMIVTGAGGPKIASLHTTRRDVASFLEKMKPQVAAAEKLGVTIAIENHANSLLSHPDSMRAFAELNDSRWLGVAFAPHHLHAWVDQIPGLIRDLGQQILFFYAQEHAPGLAQLPGQGGGLDYRPIVSALQQIRYRGLLEIFMHPTPRGIPILPTADQITTAVNRSRQYLGRCLRG